MSHSRRSPLPPTIEDRSRCAAVNIPHSGVLVIGGIGRNGLPLHSTELLTRLSNEGRGGGGDKWQWPHFPPMNKEHTGDPLVVYFQGRVSVVGRGVSVKKMLMLNMATSGQWTSLPCCRQVLIISFRSSDFTFFLFFLSRRLLDSEYINMMKPPK
ncbi:unnamed protein product [Hymenolepis diminuta]|uniref:Kelch repeat-containing protein n=1 Tax=Hymenolepis diminuta TaxID=6216 RepID=A0A0R3SYM2_HYMDI|nr:unnamed protein product [Hymenolepis diminuta]